MEQLVRSATEILAKEIDRLTLAYQSALAKAAKSYDAGMVKAHHRYSKALSDAAHSDPTAKVAAHRLAKRKRK